MIARIPTQVVRGRFGIAARVRPEARYLSFYLFGDHEPLTSRIFIELLRPGDVAVDVGANFGWFSALFAQTVGAEGRVLAFEPLPGFARDARDTIALNGQSDIVHLESCGLWSSEGRVLVHTFAGLPGGHASTSDLGRTDATAHDCQVTTLDAALTRLAVDRVDLVKVDVEGAERDVFLGAQRLLARDPAPVVHFEINQDCLAARQVTARDVFAPLRAAGYTHLWRLEGRERVDGRATLRVVAPSDHYDADYIAAKASVAPRVMQALKTVDRQAMGRREPAQTSHPPEEAGRFAGQ